MSRSSPALALSVALACALAPRAASAQAPDGAIVLVYESADPTAPALDLERVRARLASEIGATVHVAVDSSAGGAALHIRVEGGARVVLVLARDDGSRMERIADLPDDAGERSETLAILAVNMFRDEATELLALLRPEAPAVDVAAQLAPSASPSIRTPRPAETASALAGATISAGRPPEAPQRDPFLRLGLAAHFGSVSRASSAELDFIGGVEVSWTPLPFFAVGARDIGGGGTSQGDAWHFDGSPFVELALPLSFVSIYADLGAHVQLAFGDGRDGAVAGVAPFLAGGIRFRLAREVSLGIETTIRVVATDGFFTGLYELPQLAVPWTGGLSLLFHVS